MTFDEQYAHLKQVVENWDDRTEEFDGKCWRRPRYTQGSYQLFRLNDPTQFRLRPEPKMVPFGPEDVKPGMVFRHMDWPTAVKRQWAQADGAVVYWTTGPNTQTSYEELQEHWLWSTDGVTWARCEKEEKR